MVKLAVFLLKLLIHFGITCYVIIINFPLSCIDLCSNFIKVIPYILNGLHTSNQSLISVDDQIHMNINVLKFVLKQKLLNQYIQHWFQQINSSSRGEFYGIFKTEFKLEPYLIRLHHLIEYICVN